MERALSRRGPQSREGAPDGTRFDAIAEQVRNKELKTPLFVRVQGGFRGDEGRSLVAGSVLCLLRLHGNGVVELLDRTGHHLYEKSSYDERKLEILADHADLDDVPFRSLEAAIKHEPSPARLRCLSGYGFADSEEALEEGDVIEFVDKKSTEKNSQGVLCARVRRVVDFRPVGDALLVPLSAEVHCTANTDKHGFLLADIMEKERAGLLQFPLRVRLFDDDGQPSKTGGRKYTLLGSTVEHSFIALLLSGASSRLVRVPLDIPRLTVSLQTPSAQDEALLSGFVQLAELVDGEKIDAVGPPPAGTLSFCPVSSTKSKRRSRFGSLTKVDPPPLPPRPDGGSEALIMEEETYSEPSDLGEGNYAQLRPSISASVTPYSQSSCSSSEQCSTDAEGYLVPSAVKRKTSFPLEAAGEAAKAYRRQTSFRKQSNEDQDPDSDDRHGKPALPPSSWPGNRTFTLPARPRPAVPPKPSPPTIRSASSSPRSMSMKVMRAVSSAPTFRAARSLTGSPTNSPPQLRKKMSAPAIQRTMLADSPPLLRKKVSAPPTQQRRRLSPVGAPQPQGEKASSEDEELTFINSQYLSHNHRQATLGCHSSDSSDESEDDIFKRAPSKPRRASFRQQAAGPTETHIYDELTTARQVTVSPESKRQSHTYTSMSSGVDTLAYYKLKCKMLENDLKEQEAIRSRLEKSLEELKMPSPRTGKPDGKESETMREISPRSKISFSVDDVVSMLESANLGQYADAFRNEGVDGELLPHLTEEMLRDDFNVASKFHRLKLIKLIDKQTFVA